MSRRRRRRRSGSTSAAVVLLLVVVLVGTAVLRCASRREGAFLPRVRPAPSRHHERAAPPAPGARVAPETAGPALMLGTPVDHDPSDDVLLDEREYVVSYNPKRLDPNWSAWRLDRSDLGHIHRRNDFRPDSALPAGIYHVTPHDYVRSGYDRGHLCPSADRDATLEMNAMTFLMTNMVPQLHELNAGPWEKLEQYERELAGTPGAELYIVAGSVFGAAPPSIRHGIAVPEATWKIIAVLLAGQTAKDVTPSTRVIAVIMPNQPGVGDHAWTDYLASVDEIERQTGYDFLSNVPDAVEQVIEARIDSGP